MPSKKLIKKSTFKESVRYKEASRKKSALGEVTQRIADGEDVRFAYYNPEVDLYRIDGETGLWQTALANTPESIRAFDVVVQAWKRFVPAHPTRIQYAANQMIRNAGEEPV